MVGPNLYGVFGRHAAGQPDFAYSTAMKRADIVWSEDTLNAYIASPQTVVPGNRMAYPGKSNPADRRDLVAYLKSLGEE